MVSQEELEKYWRILAKKNYEFFLTYVSNRKYKHAKHTKYICDILEKVERGEIRRVIFSMPPRHSKSETITKFFPVWFLGRNPDKEVMIASYSSELASSFSRLARNTMEQYGQELFNIGVASDSSAANRWGIEGTRGGLFATGVGGSATGKGYTLGIIDDPIKNMEEAMSPVHQEKLLEWWRSVFRTRSTNDGRIIVVMTRWSQNDLAQHLINEAQKDGEKWLVVEFPAIAEEEDVLGRKAGEPLWPERFDLEEYMNIKRTLGTRVWNALYQCRPSPAGGVILKRDWFKYYTVLPQIESYVISVDATFKDGNASDFVVMQCWGKKGAEYYLVDQIRSRMDFTTTVNTLRMFCNKHPYASRKLIEDKANGSAIINVLRKEIGGILPINPQGSKTSRVSAIAPYVEAGNIYLPSKANWVGDFVEECIVFPNGKNDDQPDAMAQAINNFNSATAKAKVKVY